MVPRRSPKQENYGKIRENTVKAVNAVKSGRPPSKGQKAKAKKQKTAAHRESCLNRKDAGSSFDIYSVFTFYFYFFILFAVSSSKAARTAPATANTMIIRKVV